MKFTPAGCSWEQQPGESARAFHAFSIYRDLGFKRSLKTVCERLAFEARASVGDNGNPNTLEIVRIDPKVNEASEGQRKTANRKVSGKIYSWSREWKWVQRAEEHDKDFDRRLREAQYTETAEMLKAHRAINKGNRTVLAIPAQRLFAKLQDPDLRKTLDDIPISDLLGMAIECASRSTRVHKEERLSHGMVAKKGEDGDGGQYILEVAMFDPGRKPAQIAEGSEQLETDNPFPGEPEPKE